MPSIRRRFGIAAFSLALLPVLAFTFGSSFVVFRYLKESVQASLASITNSVGMEIDRYISAAKESLGSFDAFARSGTPAPTLEAWQTAEVAGHAEYDSILRLDAEGIVLAASSSNSRLVGFDYSGQPAFREALATRSPTLSPPFVSPNDGSVTVAVYAPVADGLGVVTLKLDRLSSFLVTLRLSSNDLIAIEDGVGRVIACTDPLFVREQRYLPGIKGFQSREWGKSWLVSGASVAGIGWKARYYRDAAELRTVLSSLGAMFAFLGCAAFMAALAMMRGFRRFFDRPFDELRTLATALASGDYTRRLPSVGVEEFIPVGVAFNAMAENIERRDKTITADLAEKVVLLQEVHHRVKNNLQIMASLLRLGASSITDPEARLVFRASEDRVYSMALVHEILYGTEDFGAVNMREYSERLLSYLLDAYPVPGLRTACALEDLELPLDKALPLGLLLNELVTNCCKHGLPTNPEPCLSVRLRSLPGGTEAVLEVADNGCGFAEAESGDGLGRSLVRNLALQLSGALSWMRATPEGSDYPGLAVTLRFPLEAAG